LLNSESLTCLSELVVEQIAQVGGLGGSDGDADCDGELEDEVEGGEDVPDAGSELVGAEGDQQHDADDEGEPSSDDQERCELVEVAIGSASSVFEVDVPRASHFVRSELPEKCRPTSRMVNTRQTAKPVRCAEVNAICLINFIITEVCDLFKISASQQIQCLYFRACSLDFG
jgi:hypothetical protein